MRVMITGGGTGGHTSPAVAIIEELRQRDPGLVLQWVGRAGGLEERVAKALGVPFRAVPVLGWPRSGVFRKAWVAAILAIGVVKAWLLLKTFRPNAVVGVGGYVSLPLGWAAQRIGIPVFLHEQNRLLGMANRMLAPKAAHLFLSFADTKGSWPKDLSTVVGNPVRPAFLNPPSREEARARFSLRPDIPVVLLVGGSQGAHALNAAMTGALPLFHPDEAQILWMTGAKDAPEARKAAESAVTPCQVFNFIDDMPAACAAADLIISRSGASMTSEIAVLGKPSILAPYPFATDNHQEQNAQAFVEAGAAIMMHDAECAGETLADAIRRLLAGPERLAAMGTAASSLGHPGAAEAIVSGILTTVSSR